MLFLLHASTTIDVAKTKAMAVSSGRELTMVMTSSPSSLMAYSGSYNHASLRLAFRSPPPVTSDMWPVAAVVARIRPALGDNDHGHHEQHVIAYISPKAGQIHCPGASGRLLRSRHD